MMALDCDVAVVGAGTAGLAAERKRRERQRRGIVRPSWRASTSRRLNMGRSSLGLWLH